MTNQPDALRVADALEVDKWHVAGVTLQTAADLLREQHAEIERLRAEVLAEREACARIVEPSADHRRNPEWYIGGEEAVELLIELAAAIRARGEKP
jgi:hypothetical protein